MIIDTSVLLEILLSQPLKDICLKEITGKSAAISSITYYEAFKKLRSKLSDGEAMEAISSLKSFPHLDLTPDVALTAADLSLQYKLGMADSLMLAHAKIQNVELLTLDNDFSSIPNVKIIRKSI